MAEEITVDTLKMAAEIVEKASRFKNLVRIPPRLFQAQPQAYTPLFVSVGPFHHIGPYSTKDQDGKNRFKDVNILASETKKQAYMFKFLSNLDKPAMLESFQLHLREKLDEIASLYREEIEISHELLANIIILDSCFLLGFLSSGRLDIMFSAFRRDLALLENQVPFSVLEDFKIIYGRFNRGIDLGSSIILTFKLCPYQQEREGYHVRQRVADRDLLSESIHLLDFIYRYYALERSASIELNVPSRIRSSRAVHLRNATKLSASGVTIECAQGDSSYSVLDLSFLKGVLRIPPLLISDYTETLFINLLAHEHLSPNYREYFTSYVFLMGQLIESKGDLQLLEKKGIIHNELGSRGDVSKLFSDIAKQFVLKDFFYSKLCNEIEDYADSTWQRHIQVLKERYFSNPWTTLSVFAATILLLLTFMQTFYTVLSYYQGGPPR